MSALVLVFNLSRVSYVSSIIAQPTRPPEYRAPARGVHDTASTVLRHGIVRNVAIPSPASVPSMYRHESEGTDGGEMVYIRRRVRPPTSALLHSNVLIS